MVSNSLKKMIVFSSEESRRTLEGVLKDITKETRQSESAIVEKALENAILPEHEAAIAWVSDLYSAEPSEEAVASAYERYFAYISAGAVGKDYFVSEPAKTMAFNFCQLLSLIPVGSVSLSEESIKAFDGMKPHLMDMLNIVNQSDGEALFVAACKDELKGSLGDSWVLDVACMIQRNWQELSLYLCTYRVLRGLARVLAKDIRSTPSARVRYCEAVKSASRLFSSQ